ncbi:MAG TPA: dehydrogenase [Myxococcales bacterium]|jgi:predicted amino acid dehydrogenase
MQRIVSVSLGASNDDYELRTRFLGREFQIRRYGADRDVDRAVRLVTRWQAQADAIGLDLQDFQDRTGPGLDHARERLLDAADGTPATTGEALRGLADEWALRRVLREHQDLFANARTFFFSGSEDHVSARLLSESTRNLFFADPLYELGIPKLLTSMHALEVYRSVHPSLAAGRVLPRRLREAWNGYVLKKAMQRAHVVVGPLRLLEDCSLEELGGKVVVTSAVNDRALSWLRDEGVDVVVDRTPSLVGRGLGLDVLDALILAALRKTADQVTGDDYLRILEARGGAPRVLFPSGEPRRVRRFAFVIHPLSPEHLKRVKSLDLASRVVPRRFASTVERLVAYAPPFVYSKVTGIRSPQGVEAEGWLITLGGTPRQLLSHSPEFTYRRLLAASRMAERLGAQLMGLGAFTKVVGDAGVTVAHRSRLPITTGNSYSASGALWAAQDAAKRMGLLHVGADGRVAGRAMVVGATGAIGSVCSRLLAMAFEEVLLVSPEVAKLLALKESILGETPHAKVALAAAAGENLREMDLIVTATSGAGKKVLDIAKVQPGAIITDVARPLDLSPEDVASRPDVLVIESGEILLPGEVRMKPIGLPPNVVYACLAETIVLALEGRFECFTVGRNIEWEKVKEIYKLGLKHGMRLAAISGVNGVYSDADIRRVRELALKRRAELEPRPAAAKPKVAAAASRSAGAAASADLRAP